jgi:hypothetical protein
MAIIQISKIQQRSGNLVDLPQLDEAEFGWATDAKKLYIGKTTPNENVEILTSYSNINFSALDGSYGNLNIDPVTAQDGQVLTFDGSDWVNRGGESGGLINLGDVSNVKITGGAIGYILETDGLGNLSWTPKGTIIAFIENVTPALIPTRQTSATTTVAATDIITVGNTSGYTLNVPVAFSGTGFGNITPGTLYYVKDVISSTELTITDSPGNPNIALTDASGTLTLNIVGTILTTVDNNFLSEGAEITITDAIGMTELNGNTYYVDLLTSNTVALFTNPGLTTPLYSNNYNSYAYTALVESFNANYNIQVDDSTEFSLNDPIRFVGDLGTSGLETDTTYYINAIPSSTALVVSATITDGIAGNAYPVQNELFGIASVYVEGGRLISPIGGTSGTEAAGSNTTIQFNNNNLLDGDAGLTWNFGLSPKVFGVTGNANITGNVNAGVSVISPILISNIATGTAPLTVSSTTRVANLNVARANVSDNSNVQTISTGTFYPTFVNGSSTDNYQLYSNIALTYTAATGVLGASGITATANVTAPQIISNVATGTAPFIVDSTTLVANLNVAAAGTLVNGTSNVAIPAADGNVNISSAGNANIVVVTGTGANITGTLNATGIVTAGGNLSGANISTAGVLSVTGNANTGNLGTTTAIITTGNITTINSGLLQNGNSNIAIPAANGNVNISAIGNANILVVTGTGVNVAGTLNVTGNANAGNLGAGNIIGVIRPTSGQGANGIIFPDNPGGGLGDTAFIQYYSYSGEDARLEIQVGNDANDYIWLNANGGVTVENSLRVNGNANITGSLTVSNVAIITTGNISTINTSVIQNGNSNLAIPAPNGNVTISVTGVVNVATYTSDRLIIAGNIETSIGAISANGNITANGNISGGNLSITTNTTTGSLTTATITAPTSNITISAAGTNESILLQPTGTGTVDVAGKRITQVGSVTSPSDATNKEYVDAIAGTGLTIHNPANVGLTTNLAGTYVVGGTTQTTTTISGGNTITFSAVHGLSVNDGIVWTNSFNGIIGGEAYWVESVPSTTEITIKDGYFGSQITTLTNGTGLSQASRANPGVGATLTNSGALAALVIDGVTVSASQRVLLLGQSTGAQNGVYVVTDPGSGAVAWVLTRSTDMNKYIPGSSSGMGAGDYVFVTQGTTNFGTSWVLSSPTDEIIIGTDSVSFNQFSAAGAYTSGSGITISGTVISANTDGTTTGIVAGNIAVIANAALTTPNIGAATGTSLVVTGNITANNISVSNLANVTGNITTNANVLANVNVVANGNISGNNFSASNNITATGNITGGNFISTGYFYRSVGTGISGNGANQTTATGLTKEINVVSTVNSGTGVRLPTAVAGMAIIITNTSANNLLVYPNTSGIINSLAANAGYTMPASATLQFVAPTTTQWYTVGASYA